MKKSFMLWMICLGFFMARPVNAIDVYNLFPAYKGWEKAFNNQVYTPDDLWDYIDGAAESYVMQDFVDLHIADYTKGKQTIRVEIYRQKDADHGFGIYSQERSPDLNFIDIGTKGYEQGNILNFLNGEYYVKISASSDKKSVLVAMLDIARQLSANINPDPKLPAVLSDFPEEGRLHNQDAFISTSFMGHEFLNSVFKASYKVGDASFSLFIIREVNADSCKQILRQYLDYTHQQADNLTEGRLTIKDPYNGNIEILWKGNRICGVSGTDNNELAEKYLGMVGK